MFRYILADDGVTPIRCDDLYEWAIWYQTAERHVAHDMDEHDTTGQQIRVSTVFLGVDHAFGGGPPILWETMVFGGLLDGEQVRYTSHAAALAGHQEMCRHVADSLKLVP
jgi:hypothetical protein